MNHFIAFDYDSGQIGINGWLEPVNPVNKDVTIAGLPLWAVIALLTLGMGMLLALIAYLFSKYKYRRLQEILAEYDMDEDKGGAAALEADDNPMKM